MKISIIIPVYNAEKTLPNCIEHLLNQTWHDFELILINDNSNDNTWQIALNIANKDNRIKLINNRKNIGAGLSRNKGLNIAQGEWITFCDADDYPEENWLSDFVFGASENTEMVIQGFYCDNCEGNEIITNQIVAYDGINNRNIIVNALCNKDVFGYLWCKMYRASIIKKNHLQFTNLKFLEDEMFNLQYLKYTQQIACIPTCNYHYIRPDFYAKYGKSDSFDVNIKLFKQACDTFGNTPIRIKDILAERICEWLWVTFHFNNVAKRKKTQQFCAVVGPYLPNIQFERKGNRLIKFLLIPKYPTLCYHILNVIFIIKDLFIKK
jgi:glycosyltransferase involved in cell wall biosynthesis